MKSKLVPYVVAAIFPIAYWGCAAGFDEKDLIDPQPACRSEFCDYATETVTSVNGALGTVLELDANDLPTVFYATNTSEGGSLWRSDRQSGAWKAKKIASDSTRDIATMAVASSDEGTQHVVLSRYASEGQPLRHGSGQSEWRFSDITLDNNVYTSEGGARQAIAVGANEIAVTFYDTAHDQILHASQRPETGTGDWSLRAIQVGFLPVLGISTAFDSVGMAHIGYIQVIEDTPQPFYAHWDDAEQYFVENQATFVYREDAAPHVGSAFAFGLHTNNDPYFVLFDRKTKSLNYFRRTGWFEWEQETISTDVQAWLSISAAVAPGGEIHVTYYDENTRQLRHAARKKGEWLVSVVREARRQGTQVFTGTSIAVDGAGRTHFVFRDEEASELIYAIGPG